MTNFTSWGATTSTPNGLADRTGLFGFVKKGQSNPGAFTTTDNGKTAPGGGGIATPASSSVAAIPLDPIYQSQLGAYQNQRDALLAQFAAARPKVLADYGYTSSGYDSTGAPTGLTFDVNNPFSRAALLQRSAQQQQAGTTNSMAARGQLYSGALASQQRANEFNYQQGSDALQKALIQALVGIASNEAAAKTNYDVNAAQALADSLGRAQATAPTPPPAAPVPSAPAGYSGARGLQKIGGELKYVDANGGVHDTTTRGGKTYYLNSNGGWTPIG